MWTKQTEDERTEDFWELLSEIDKERNFNTISAELLIPKYKAAITDKMIRKTKLYFKKKQ